MMAFHLLTLSMLSVLSLTAFGNRVCDTSLGYWTEKLTWQPMGCKYPRQFSELLSSKNFSADHTDKKASNYRILLFGDSNDEKIISDNNSPIGGDCRYAEPITGKGIFHCSNSAVSGIRYSVISAFPYPNEVLNYCVELKDTTPERRTLTRNNSQAMEEGFQVFHQHNHAHPNIVGLSINFWEMVRIREEMSCETGTVAAESKARWERTHLDQDFIHRWMNAMENTFREGKQRANAVSAIFFTRTFQVPRLESNGFTTHTNIHSGIFVRQLNSAIRAAAQKANIYVLDIERMTDFFWDQTIYLHDLVHFKAFISEEIYNILFYWRNQHNHVSE